MDLSPMFYTLIDTLEQFCLARSDYLRIVSFTRNNPI